MSCEHEGGKAPIAQHRHQTGIVPYCPEQVLMGMQLKQEYSWMVHGASA